MPPTTSDKGIFLEVTELFRSIAGETTQAGRPAAFVRLSGCNLRCSWCDTRKSWQAGRRLSLSRTLELLLSRRDRLIVVTGGEPLLQSGTLALCEKLVEQEREILLETNGSLDIRAVPEGVRTILDVKTPSSGESERMELANLERLRPEDELKMIIASRADFDWCCDILDHRKLPEKVNILFSPASQLLEPATLAGWILDSDRNVRMQLQLHKSIWPDGGEGEQILDVPENTQ